MRRNKQKKALTGKKEKEQPKAVSVALNANHRYQRNSAQKDTTKVCVRNRPKSSAYARHRDKKPLLNSVAVIVGFRACVRWRSGERKTPHTLY